MRPDNDYEEARHRAVVVLYLWAGVLVMACLGAVVIARWLRAGP